jgi:hypothetical protein
VTSYLTTSTDKLHGADRAGLEAIFAASRELTAADPAAGRDRRADR